MIMKNDRTRGYTPYLEFTQDAEGEVVAADLLGCAYGIGATRGEAVAAWHSEAISTLAMLEAEPRLSNRILNQRRFLRLVVDPRFE